MIELFGMTIGLRMIRGCIHVCNAKDATYICGNTQSELFSVVSKTLAWWTAQKTPMLVKAVAMSCAVVVRKNSISVSFEEQSFTTCSAVLPLLDFTGGQRMSVVIFVKGSVAGNSSSSMAFPRILISLRAQKVQVVTALYVSTLIDGQ